MGYSMKLALKIGTAYVLLCASIAYGMEINLTTEETEQLEKLSGTLTNLSLVEKPNIKQLITDVLKPEYTGQRDKELQELGKTIASLYLFSLHKAPSYEKKVARLNLYLEAGKPSYSLFATLVTIPENSPERPKILNAIKHIASGAQERLLSTTLDNKILFAKNAHNQTSQTAAERLYLEFVKKIIGTESKSYESIKGITTPEDLASLEIHVMERLQLKLDYFEKSKAANCVQEFAQCLQDYPSNTPVDSQILQLQSLKQELLCKIKHQGLSKKIDLNIIAADGKQLANQFLMTLYSCESVEQVKKLHENYISAFNAVLGALGLICANNPSGSDMHQKALEGFRAFFKAFVEKLATIPCNTIDFSKGINQDFAPNKLANEGAISIFKNMQNLAIMSANADSHKKILDLVNEWEKEETSIRSSHIQKLKAEQEKLFS